MVRWILAELGSQEAASPTFAIHHRYDVIQFEVDHFDLYRLNSDAELEETGFWDMITAADNLVLVEWADRLPREAFPKDRRIVTLNIELRADGVRVLTWALD
jgi:tRNA threonylcarbamoyladenosine biosynthesis protein TsaE